MTGLKEPYQIKVPLLCAHISAHKYKISLIISILLQSIKSLTCLSRAFLLILHVSRLIFNHCSIFLISNSRNRA